MHLLGKMVNVCAALLKLNLVHQDIRHGHQCLRYLTHNFPTDSCVGCFDSSLPKASPERYR